MVDKGTSTISSPKADDRSLNAPDFNLHVQGAQIPAGVRSLVERVEYESAEGMADIMRIVFRDPRYIPPKGMMPAGSLGSGGSGPGAFLSLRDVRVFLPGNEIDLWLGYGPNLKHVGRTIIRKVRPSFPRGDEIPSVEVIGYTKDSAMMDSAPIAPKPPPKRKKGVRQGRKWTDTTFADCVKDLAEQYGFETTRDGVSTIDDTPDKKKPHTFIQKTGLSDYDFIKGLSNITGYFFWVDGTQDGKWYLHFRNPRKLRKAALQDKIYTFTYDQGPNSSLLSFEPELAITGAITKIQARTKDPETGNILDSTFEEEVEETPDPLLEAGRDLDLRPIDMEGNVIKGHWTTAQSVRVFINDFSFEAKTTRRFRSQAELVAWARQWFRRHRENFVQSNATMIGVEDVMSRQIHKVSGLGMGLDGEYFFNSVQHVISNSNGYELNVHCRKVVPEMDDEDI